MPGQFDDKRGSMVLLERPAAWLQQKTLHQGGQIHDATLLCEENGELRYPYNTVAAATPMPHKKKRLLGTTPSSCCPPLLNALILDSKTSALGGLLVAVVLTLIVRRLDIIDKKLSP